MIKKQKNGKFRARIYSDGKEIASKTFALKRDADAWEVEQYRQRDSTNNCEHQREESDEATDDPGAESRLEPPHFRGK